MYRQKRGDCIDYKKYINEKKTIFTMMDLFSATVVVAAAATAAIAAG